MENIAKTGGETKQNINDLSYSIHHWGPLLFKIKMLPQDLKSLKKLCSKSNENWGKNLAGIIKDEFKIDSAKYIKIITPYLKAYQQAYLTWYGLNLKKVEVTAAWVNYMKAGEGNPPHIHHNCHLSSVIILDIPKKLKKEQQDWYGSGEGPGALSFFMATPQNFHTNSFAFTGEVGDFFIFPWNLTHSVSTFRSPGTRTTVAANFYLHDDNIFEDKNGKKT